MRIKKEVYNVLKKGGELMNNIKYILTSLTKMNYKAMLNKVNEVHKKTGNSRI